MRFTNRCSRIVVLGLSLVTLMFMTLSYKIMSCETYKYSSSLGEPLHFSNIQPGNTSMDTDRISPAVGAVETGYIRKYDEPVIGHLKVTKTIKKTQRKASATISSTHQRLGAGSTTLASSSLSAVSNSSAMLESESGAKRKQFLIYLCDKADYCYGLGDRQRGLVAVYLLALVTDRQFGINMSHPWPLADFYMPSQVQWNIPESEVQGKSTTTIRYFKNQDGELKTINFNTVYPQDVIYVRTNLELWRLLKVNKLYQYKLPAWTRGRRHNIFSHAWLQLATPTRELRAQLNELLVAVAVSMLNTSSSETNSSSTGVVNATLDAVNATLDAVNATLGAVNATLDAVNATLDAVNATLGPSLKPSMSVDEIRQMTGYSVAKLNLVCVHVRIGHSETLPFEKNRRNKREWVQTVWDFLQPYIRKGHHVYIASDNNGVRQEAKALFGDRAHSLDSAVLHLGTVMNNQDAREGLKTALLEQLLLMTSCQVLMVSRSGFSMAAAYVRAELMGETGNYFFDKGYVFGWNLW